MSLKGKVLAQRIAELTLDKKAEDLLILDLRGVSDIADYFIICTGLSDTQVRAIAGYIEEELKKVQTAPLSVEGYLGGQWVLLDYFDIIVHIFLPQTRDFYAIESLWGDAPEVKFN